MTTNDQTPEPTPAAQAAPAVPYHTGPHGYPHQMHHPAGAAVIVMIVGSLVFAMFAFGAGFAIRGVVDRHMGGRGGSSIGCGYGQESGLIDRRFDEGRDQFRGGMMRGYPRDQRDGYDWSPTPPQNGQGGGQGFVPNVGAVPPTTTP